MRPYVLLISCSIAWIGMIPFIATPICFHHGIAEAEPDSIAKSESDSVAASESDTALFLRPPLLFALSKLELQPERKQQIAQILLKHRPRGRELMDSLNRKRLALTAAVRADPGSEEAVRAAAVALAKDEEILAVGVFRLSQEIKAALSKTEREELAVIRITPATNRALSSLEVIGRQVDEWIERYGK